MKKILLPLCSLCILFLLPLGLKAQSNALSVNLPSLLLGNINIEYSRVLSSRLTLHLPISVNPISYPTPAPIGLLRWSEGGKVSGAKEIFRFGTIKYNYHLTVDPGIRYWTRGAYNRGFFFGLHALGSIYQRGSDALEPNYKKGFAVGGSLSVGYSYELSPRWNIEGEFGVGSRYLSYDIYSLGSDKAIGQEQATTLDLSRLGVSLTYLF